MQDFLIQSKPTMRSYNRWFGWHWTYPTGGLMAYQGYTFTKWGAIRKIRSCARRDARYREIEVDL